MEVVVDGRGGWGSGTAGKTLGAVLDTVRRAVGRRMLVQVVLDGDELSRDRQSEMSDRLVGDFSLLEVRTVDPLHFGRETLAGIAAHIGNLERTHDEAAGLLDADEYGRATERLSECYNAWDTLSRAVRDVALIVGAELRSVDVEGLRADELVRRLNHALMRFRGAMEFRDVVRLSELADQELRPMLPQWRSLVTRIGATLPGARES